MNQSLLKHMINKWESHNTQIVNIMDHMKKISAKTLWAFKT